MSTGKETPGGSDATINVDISKQELMSAVLARKGKLTSVEIQSFAAQVEAINNLSVKTPTQKAFVEDCLATMVKINLRLDKAEKERETLRAQLREAEAAYASVRDQGNLYHIIGDQQASSARYEKKKFSWKDIVRTPDKFDGRSPNPRKWISDYEDAIELNEWDHEISVKYFPSFLTGTALSWFKTEVKPLRPFVGWDTVKEMFKSHYLGNSDEERLSQKVEEERQRPKESVRQFIPRYRELLLLLDSKMSEAEQRRRITARLRPEYKPWLAFSEPKTLQELKESCVKIEAGFEQPKGQERPAEDKSPKVDQNKKRNDQATTNKKNNSSHNNSESKKVERSDKPQASSENGEVKRSNPKCFRCERMGHVSKYCRATSKQDGSPCNPKPAPKRQVNTVTESKEPAEVLTIKHVCNALLQYQDWADADSTVEIIRDEKVQLVVGGGKLLQNNVTLNGSKYEALIDTGASCSVIDKSVMERENWKPNMPAPTLIGADGSQLKATGGITLTVELKLDRTTKKTQSNFAVVTGLAMPVLIGLTLLAKLEVVIDTASEKLSYKKQSRQSGVRVAQEQVVPARSQTIVEAKVNTQGVLMTIPFYFTNELMVARSISQVINNSMNTLVINGGPKPIKLVAGTQLGVYEHLAEESSHMIAATKTLPTTSELVNVGDELDESQLQDLFDLFEKNMDAFSLDGRLGQTDLVEHKIELLENSKPFAEPMRRRAKIQVEETKKQIRKMLAEGVIEESNSPFASAYVLAKKKSGEYRFCIDFRRLNNMTKKCVYPLPSIDECLDTLAGKRYFSQLDFASGYWQVAMAPESKELTAFRTEEGQFQFAKMPFGLTNAPATFQRMVNALLSGMKGLNLQCFIDDICVATNSWSEHLEILEKLFARIIESKLKLKSSKCTFGARRVVFLGHEISEDGIRQEPSKLKALTSLPTPKNADDVRRALGMINYYRKFIQNFAMISYPLTCLIKKNAPWRWGVEEGEAFNHLLRELAKNAVLTHFRHEDETMIKCDASKKGVAGILLQRRDGQWKIVSCCSRRLSSSEANYGITDLEGLALVYTVVKHRHYLLGKHFEILTDHCALCALNEKMPNSPRLRRWAILLSEYRYKIVYIDGQLHQDVDCLSRAPVDDELEPYLEERLCTLITPHNLFEWIKDHEDEESKGILQKARDTVDGFRLSNDVVYKTNKLYLPPCRREQAVEDAHQTSSHGSIAATLERLEMMWWKSKAEDVKKYVEACELCQRRRVERAKQSGGMLHHEVYEPNAQLAVDCLGPVAASLSGNRHVIVIIDVFTRFINAKAVPNVTSAMFTKFLVEHCGQYGVPREILMDNAMTFTSGAAKELMRVFNIKQKLSTPQHSQSNAVVERVIQTLQERIALIISDRESCGEWDFVLPVAILAINTTKHRSTGFTPYELTFGRRIAVQFEQMGEPPVQPHELHAKLINIHLDECRKKAIENQSHSQEQSRNYYLPKRKEREFELGEKVLLKIPERRRVKFGERYEGPWIVLERSNDVYKVKSLANNSTRTRHVSDMKPFKEKEAERLEEGVEAVNIISGKASQLVLLVLSLLATIAITNGYVFEKVSPVVWTQLPNYVDKGLTRFRIEIRFSQPCTALLRVKANEVVDTSSAELHCKNMYETLITMPIKEFGRAAANVPFVRDLHRPRHTKRFVAEFLTGMFFSNIAKTFLDKWWPDHSEVEMGERQKIVLEKLTELQRTLNVTELVTKAINDNLINTHEALKRTNERLNMVAIKSPELAITAAYLVTKMAIKSSLIGKIKYQFMNQEVDLQALSELLETDNLVDIQRGSAVARNMEASDFGDAMRIEFTGRRKDMETTAYRVDPFRYWGNLTNTPTLMEYVGDRYLIYNTSSNCVKAISEPTQPHISSRCAIENYEDSRLAQWRAIYSVDDLSSQIANTTLKESYPYTYIYCINLFITIRRETFRCPPYVFRLNATIPWNTTDYPYRPVLEEFEAADGFSKVEENVHDIHFRGQEHMVDENQFLDKMNVLRRSLREAKAEAIAISLPTESGGISYIAATKGLIGLFSAFIVVMVIIAIKFSVVSNKRHEAVMRTVVDTVHGEGHYDTIQVRNATRTTSSNSTSSQNVTQSPNVINLNLRDLVSRFSSSNDVHSEAM